MNDPKIPKDLKVKVGTPLEVLWTNVKQNVEKELEIAKNQILVNEELLKIARLKIKIEQKGRKL